MSARILVIEDDPMIQKLERLRLEEEQYEVVTTADPEEGLDIVGRGEDTCPAFVIGAGHRRKCTSRSSIIQGCNRDIGIAEASNRL